MKNLPGLLGSLGGIGVAFGLLSFVLALFAPIDRVWIVTNLGLGVLLLLVAGVLGIDKLRERMGSGEARRAGKFGTSAVLTTGLVVAILGMLGYTAQLFPKRFDWSEAKVHSLSDQSLKVLAQLDQDVQVTALFSPIDMPYVRELLDRYAYESDAFVVDYVDPNAKPHVLEQLAITPESLGSGLIHVTLGGESVQVQDVTEEHVTNAMVKLSRTGTKKVYFIEGHNEREIAGAPETQEGFQRAAEALRNENYEVEKLLLAATGEVPDDADVLIVAGATRPLLDEETEALARYLGGGGALMALVDPRAQTDLVDILSDWGVDVGDDVIVDRKLALFGRATTPFASRYDPEHEVTRDLRETTLFHMARSVRGEGEGDFTELVFTGDESWAERDLEEFFKNGRAELGGDDLEGPVSIAVAGTPSIGANGAGSLDPEAGEEEAGEDEAGVDEAGVEESEPPRTARLAVFGDSDFASNELIEAYRNRDLFVNTVNWLLGDVEAISIRPARSRASRFQLSTEQFTSIRTISLFVLPEAIAVLGVVTWWRRRNPSGG